MITPGDHDASDPDSRPDLLHDQVARYLEDEVPDEEDPRPETINRVAKAQILVHLQGRKPDVDPVQKRHDVQHEHKRNKA